MSDKGRVISISPFSTELAYTRYVPLPILLVELKCLHEIEILFSACESIDQFCTSLRKTASDSLSTTETELMCLLSLDFIEKSIKRII